MKNRITKTLEWKECGLNINIGHNTLYGGETEKSKRDREYIVDKINSADRQEAVQAAEFMINNLIRYAETKNKYITRAGYEAIQRNWRTIWENSSCMDTEKRKKARDYLLKEHKRIDGLIYSKEELPEIVSGSNIPDVILLGYDSPAKHPEITAKPEQMIIPARQEQPQFEPLHKGWFSQFKSKISKKFVPLYRKAFNQI